MINIDRLRSNFHYLQKVKCVNKKVKQEGRLTAWYRDESRMELIELQIPQKDIRGKTGPLS